ncbi:hypothetical protein BDV12DRAFT_210986 [Aspergillus spectabilis]
MVYCGKPSKGCGRCRSRRIKCNQERPSCSQCIRAKSDCPGYRDTLTLTFRDQSDEVIIKARQLANSKTTKRRSKVSSPAKSLPCSNDDLARGYMVSHYLCTGNGGGHLSYMSDLAGDPRNSAVYAALTAVGLATLVNVRMAPQLMLTARREYTTALSRTNLALQYMALSKRDDILAAVILLGMFEVTTCTDGSFFDRWMKHMDGAARLIEIRGPEQLGRPEGLNLFTQMPSIYREQYSLPIIVQFTEEAKKYRAPEEQTYDDFGAVGIKLIELCAAIKYGTIVQPSEIIYSALRLDAELIAATKTVPTSWNYQIVTVLPVEDGLSISQATWGNSYHVYPNISVSSAWNNYRFARLIIHELVVNEVGALEQQTELLHALGFELHAGGYSTLFNQSRQIGQQMVEDVAASVPSYLGAAMEGPGTSGNGKVSTIFSGGAVSAASGMAIVWQLLLAANSGFASQDMRRWITTVLDRIGHSMGLNQALAMARLVREGMRSRAWLDAVDCLSDFGLEMDC